MDVLLTRWARSLGVFAGACLLVACVDTTAPDLTEQFGGGPTAGSYCSIDQLSELPSQTLRIHFIDVGQGDAIWIQTPWVNDQETESHNVLVDFGSSGVVDGTGPGGQEVVSYLLDRGLYPGDAIHLGVVTHAHEDHYGGLSEVVKTFSMLNYLDPGYDAGNNGFLAARAAAQAAVAEHGLGQVHAPPGQNLVANIPGALSNDVKTPLFGAELQVDLLWAAAVPPQLPPEVDSGTATNNSSVVLALRWAGKQVLLMGDAEHQVEEILADLHDEGKLSLTSQVLKVGHHGSSTSSSERFLDAVFPGSDKSGRWAIISSGRRSFGGTQLPTDSTLERLQTYLNDYHLLSTENSDQEKASGSALGDDHILLDISATGDIQACYSL